MQFSHDLGRNIHPRISKFLHKGSYLFSREPSFIRIKFLEWVVGDPRAESMRVENIVKKYKQWKKNKRGRKL